MARERIPRASTRNSPEGLVGASEVHDLSVGGSHTGLKGMGKEIGGHIDRHPIPRMRKGAAVESQNPVQEATSPISTGAQRVSQGQGMKGTPGPSLFHSELPLEMRPRPPLPPHSPIPLPESIRTLSRLARELPGHRGKSLSYHRPGLE